MSGGPTTRRRQLGAGLRRLRERAELTLDDAGSRVGISKATVSRYETKEGSVKWPLVDALCRQYNASEQEREALVELAKSARVQGWWKSMNDSIPEWLNLLLTLEDEATSEDHFSAVYVPGLLQTRAYAEAVHHASEMRVSAEQIEHDVDVRMKRQEVLERPHPPHVWAVLDEAVIRRVVGGPATMRQQLAHLIDRAAQPHVTIQVLPFTAGAHTTCMGSFLVLGGPDPSLDVVYMDFLTGALVIEKQPEVDRYKVAFDYLRAQALDITASSAAIRQAMEAL